MRITMYELLGLVKDGKAPKKINFCGNIYEWEDDWYLTKEKNYKVCLGGKKEDHNILITAFNEDVEVIEEPKKIKKIEMYQDEEGHYFLNKQDRKVYVNCDEIDFMVDKFNELIDKINNLKEND